MNFIERMRSYVCFVNPLCLWQDCYNFIIQKRLYTLPFLGQITLPQECIDILLPLLTKLVNCSLMEGCVPDAFKSALVTPLINKPNLASDDLKNYRPKSGLSFISKLVEHVVAKQLLEHTHIHNLDNLYQSAYKTSQLFSP